MVDLDRLNSEPRDDIELHSWIEDFLGFDVPTVAATPGQQAPFEALADLYFNRVSRAVIMAARGSGKSRMLAILNLLVGKFRPGTATLSYSAVERQAGVSHGYLREMLRNPLLRNDIEESLQTRIAWRNGSKVIVSSAGAESSTIALRGHRLCIDEGDTWDPKLFQNVLLAGSGDATHPLQIIVVSTRYSEDGLLTQLFGDDAYTPFAWDFWASAERCQECIGQDCIFFTMPNDKGELQPYCRGKGLMARGFIPLDSLVNSFGAISRQTWQTQQMLMEPAARGRLFRNFDPKTHIGKAPQTGAKAVGIDWGLSPAIVLVGQADSVYWVIEEYGGRGYILGDLLLVALDIKARYGDLPFFCGSHDQLTAPTSVAWAEHGITIVPITGAMNYRELRHDQIRRLLGPPPRLMFDETCGRTIHQTRTARIRDEQGRRKAPDDFRDALAYIMAGITLAGDGQDFFPGGAFCK